VDELVNQISQHYQSFRSCPGYFQWINDNCVEASITHNPKTGYWITSYNGNKLKRTLDPVESAELLLNAIITNHQEQFTHSLSSLSEMSDDDRILITQYD
jgi:hypothetical protein